ncbi:MAG: PKD domain-containing protein, partial [Bacteroidales bacterium]
MKQTVTLFLFLVLSILAYSQNNPSYETPTDAANYPYWVHMMQDPDIPLAEVQQAFTTYWQGRKITKGSGWKPFKRWEWMMSQRLNPDGSRPQPLHVSEEYEAFLNTQASSTKSLNGNWQALGPEAMPTNGTSQPNGLGRINHIAFHPSNSNVMYAAAPSGGAWKTTDGGTTWAPLTDTMPSLGTSCILIDHSDTSIIYLGSGDRDAGDAPGLGVMKSTDGGQSWNIINSGMGNETVGDMLMHPTNSNIILAATSDGLYRTTNGGASWSRTSNSTDHFKDLEFKPNDPNTVYAAGQDYYGNSYFFKSTNNGQSWSNITSGLPGSGRYVIGVSADSANYVYVVAGDQNGLVGCYRSINSGSSFSTQSTSPNILGYSTTGSDNASQAWYDLAIAIDPNNVSTIYVGGINIWKSTNGGASWSLNAHWVGNGGVPAVHADIHSLDFSPVNNRLYSGNDGGVHYTANGGSTWTEISDDLAIAQVYKLGQSASQQNLIINGYQDNGTAIYNNGTWTTEIGGDGMECIIDPDSNNYMYGALYYGNIRRSTNAGTDFYQIAADQINGITESGAWVTPYTLDINNSNHMIVGYKNLWRSTNVKTTNPGSVSWSKLTNNLGSTNNENIRVIEQSEADDNILYFFREDNKMYRSDNFKVVNPSFTDISSNLPLSQSYPFCSDIEAHPTNSNIVYMTYYQDVYKSSNKGQSWTNITGNLPSISINTIVLDTAANNEALYVGTDAGIYYKDNSMSNWVPFMDNLPVAAIVTELEIFYNSNHQSSKIVASTYGRGTWRSDLYSSGNLVPAAEFGYDQTVICTGDTITFSDSSLYSPSSWSWSFTPSTVTYVNGTSSTSQNPVVKFTTAGYYTVTLTATNSNGNDTITKNNLIKAGGVQPPLTETFESTSATLGEWGVYNPDSGITWALATVNNASPGNQAVFMNNYAYSSTGERDDLFSMPLNLSNVSAATLSFEHAYTRYSGYASDSLIIYASSDCGTTWTRLWAKAEDGSGNFATAPDNTYQLGNSFSPAIGDWCSGSIGPSCFTVSLNNMAGNDNVYIRFQGYNNYSNNLYLDNISITGTNQPSVSASFSSSSTNVCTGDSISFSSTAQNATSYQWKESGNVLGTNQNLSWSFSNPGTYIVWLIVSNSTSVDSTSQTITVNSVPGQSATPSGPDSLCQGTSNTNYTVNTVSQATDYNWTLTPPTAGTLSHNNNTATVSWDNSYFGTATLKVAAVNSCGAGDVSPNLDIAILNAPPKPVITQSNDTLYSSSPTNNQWFLSTGPIAGAVQQFYLPTVNSVYFVEVSNPNGCNAKSDP